MFHTPVSLTTLLSNISSKWTMCSFYPFLLWLLFVFLRSLSVWKCQWVLIILPTMAVIPSKFTERYVYLRECCTYLLLLILKRCFDYARYGMCNLISHYLILSPGRCSVQSCSLNPRHRFSGEKWCVAAQFQLISHYTCRDTPFSLIFHVSRAGLIPFH